MAQLRILPQEVVNAYKGKDLRPQQGGILKRTVNGLLACGLGAIAFKPRDAVVYFEHDSPEWESLYVRLERKYGQAYIEGFMTGFDTWDKPTEDTERCIQGFEDGRAAYHAAFEAFHLM
jgi:hypothetical protein